MEEVVKFEIFKLIYTHLFMWLSLYLNLLVVKHYETIANAL